MKVNCIQTRVMDRFGAISATLDSCKQRCLTLERGILQFRGELNCCCGWKLRLIQAPAIKAPIDLVNTRYGGTKTSMSHEMTGSKDATVIDNTLFGREAPKKMFFDTAMSPKRRVSDLRFGIVDLRQFSRIDDPVDP